MNKRIIFEYLQQVGQLSGIACELFSGLVMATLVGAGTILSTLVFWAMHYYGVDILYAHLGGFSVTGIFLFMTMSIPWYIKDSNHTLQLRHAAGFVLILVFSISLQGAVFSLGQLIMPLHPLIAFVPAALSSSVVFTLFCVVYLFSDLNRLARKVQIKIAITGGVAALILLRFVYLGLPELMEQEAYYWNYAQHPGLSYLDHPPMAALLIWVGTALFGTTEFGVRIGAFLTWFVTAFFVYRLSDEIFNRTAAFGSLFLVSLLPLYFGTGFVITPDSSLHAAWAAFIYFLYRCLIKGSNVAWLGVGMSLGIGLLSKYTIVLLGPGIVLYLIIDKRARAWFWRPEPYGALLLGLLIFSPVIIWNYQHDWNSFLFQGEERFIGKELFTTHRLIFYITILLTPAGLLSMIYFFGRGNLFFRAHANKCFQAEDRLFNRSFLLLLLLILSPLLVFLGFSMTKEVKLNWTSPVWLGGIPFLGCTLAYAYRGIKSVYLEFLHWFWKVSAYVLIIGYSTFFHYATLGLPFLPLTDDLFLFGWVNLAKEVESVSQRVEKQIGNRPLVVGMDPYQISSGLAFYRAKLHRGDRKMQKLVIKETMGWHLFGWRGLMYEFWANPEDLYGRDILVVGSSKIRVEKPYFQKRFVQAYGIQSFNVTKNGSFVNRYYHRVLRNYRPALK